MIDKTMTIREVLNIDPGTAHIMMSFGMHCLTCPCATAESLEEAAMVHGINVDEMVDQLNAYLAEKQKEGNEGTRVGKLSFSKESVPTHPVSKKSL